MTTGSAGEAVEALWVIDPGHGGAEGARGPAGALEKDVTLRLAHRLRAHLGDAARLTREADTPLSSEARASFVERSGARFFLSLHANTGAPGERGAETWVHPWGGRASLELALTLQRALGEGGFGDRGVKAAELSVLSPRRLGPGVGACLLEVDFLSDPAGERALCDDAHLERLARVLAAAVRAHTARAADGRGYGSPVGAGRAELDCPVLAPHGGPSPRTILRWNIPAGVCRRVDVAVHLHGYSSDRARMRLTNKERFCGLDFDGDPDAPGTSAVRTRATLGVLPRGKYTGDGTHLNRQRVRVPNNPEQYTFPELTSHHARGVTTLVRCALDAFATDQLGQTAGSVDAGRLLVTAHSGGGSPLMTVVGNHDPHEAHVFDALYGGASALIRWALVRLQADVTRLGALAPSAWSADMRANGGALRVIYLTGGGTQAASLEVHRALRAALASLSSTALAAELGRFYRVEGVRESVVSHLSLPRTYAFQLMADAAADLSPATTAPAEPTAREKRRALQPYAGVWHGDGAAAHAFGAPSPVSRRANPDAYL